MFPFYIRTCGRGIFRSPKGNVMDRFDGMSGRKSGKGHQGYRPDSFALPLQWFRAQRMRKLFLLVRGVKAVFLLVVLLCAVGMSAAVNTHADEHREGTKEHHEMKKHISANDGLKTKTASLVNGDDDGNEITGQMAAWFLGGANLTIVLSILIKWMNRFLPLGSEMKSLLTRLNARQKKALMWSHYYVNPLILGVALLHWLLSRCPSTALPEWGLLMMGTLTLLGITLKFKLCPRTLRGKLFKWHTQPALFIALIVLLVAGHSIVD